MNLTFLLSAVALIETLQALLLVLRFVDLPPLGACWVFLGLLLIFHTAAMYLGRGRRFDDRKGSLLLYAGLQAVLTAILIEAAYKLVIYDYQPQLARGAFDVVMTAAVLAKIFWKQLKIFLVAAYGLVVRLPNRAAVTVLADVLVVAFLVLFIYVPDGRGALARMFIGEQFHHWDFFMAPAWAYLKGALPYVDVISQYGVGIPVVMGLAGKFFGGFSYERIFSLFVILVIMYYIGLYVFLRQWLKSLPIALCVLFMGIKTQMFHPGVNPFVFTYPSSIVLRNILDVFFFFTILAHLNNGRQVFLWLAALLAGLAIFNLTDTGVYLTGAFYVYVLFNALMPQSRLAWPVAAGLVTAVPVLVMALFYAVVGHHVFTGMFWYNIQEYIVYFLAGHGMVPMTEDIHYHFYWQAFMSVAMPLLYIFTMLLVGILCYLQKIDRRHIFVVVLCVYGLGLYHYFVARSVLTSYYVSGLPFFLVLGFWIKAVMGRLNLAWRLPLGICGAAIAFFALMTTHQVSAYPNVFNFSRNPLVDPAVTLPWPDERRYFNHLFITMGPESKLPVNSLGETDEWLFLQSDFKSDDQVKKFYDQEFDLKEDAKLIASLTRPDEAVAMVSSFEVRLLMQADRKPFFYFMPVLFSRPMHMRTYPLECVHSAGYLKKMMDQMKDGRPPYIFMERVFLQTEVPPSYKDDYTRLLEIVGYIRAHYEPVSYGKYLVAMKRKID